MTKRLKPHRDLTNSHFSIELRRQVEAELTMAASRDPEPGEPATWLVDPTDADRTATGLHSLLGAIQALGDVPPVVVPPEGSSAA